MVWGENNAELPPFKSIWDDDMVKKYMLQVLANHAANAFGAKVSSVLGMQQKPLFCMLLGGDPEIYGLVQ